MVYVDIIARQQKFFIEGLTDMAEKMLAAFVKTSFQFKTEEVDVPEVKDDWALVKVEACGICGTDLHYANHLATEWQGFGHEVAGVVVKSGRGVNTAKEGDH